MSYILDALKKAERERGIAQVPTLATVHDLPAPPRFRLWVIAGIGLLGIVVALWFVLPLRQTNSERVPSRAGGPGAASGPPGERTEEATPAGTHEGTAAAHPVETETVARTREAAIQRSAANDRRLPLSSQVAPVRRPNTLPPEIPPHEEIELPPPQQSVVTGNSRTAPRPPDTVEAKPKSLR